VKAAEMRGVKQEGVERRGEGAKEVNGASEIRDFALPFRVESTAGEMQISSPEFAHGLHEWTSLRTPVEVSWSQGVESRSPAEGEELRGCRVRRSFGTECEEAQVGTEAEALDANLKRGAAAAEEALEKRLELEGAGDVLIDFGEFPGGELFPARTDRSIFAEATEEEFDFGEGEAHVTGEADE
jgi:hypothetical protein